MKKIFKHLVVASTLAVASITGVIANAAGHGNERYVLVSHAPDSDSWWNTIKNGIALAGDQMGVEVEYRNPPTGTWLTWLVLSSKQRPLIPTAS